MARSFFPDLTGGTLGSALEARARAHNSGPAMVPRVAWLATLLLAGLACVLAAVFAGLWWRGEVHAESLRVALDRMGAETSQLIGDQSRQRRVLAATKIGTSGEIMALREETGRLRQAIETSQAETAAAEKGRQELTVALERQLAMERRQTAVLQQERSRAATLEQNLALTQNDLNLQSAEHDRRVDSLQTHLITLRDTVTVRDIEVRDITTTATHEIERARIAAQEVVKEAEWLAAQLRSVTCERDQFRQEVNRLRQELDAARAENHHLRQCVHQLECRVRELETRLAQKPPGQGNGSGSPAPVP